MYRKGSVVFRRSSEVTEVSSRDNRTEVKRMRNLVVVEHCDIIGDSFWQDNPQILQN